MRHELRHVKQHVSQGARSETRMGREACQPVYVFRELLYYLATQRIVSPAYRVMQNTVGKALTAEQNRLTAMLRHDLGSTSVDIATHFLYPPLRLPTHAPTEILETRCRGITLHKKPHVNHTDGPRLQTKQLDRLGKSCG